MKQSTPPPNVTEFLSLFLALNADGQAQALDLLKTLVLAQSA